MYKTARKYMPGSRLGRTVAGIVLIIGGLLGFLPILGFWMVPFGLIFLSVDSAFIRRRRRRSEIWLGRRWQKWREERRQKRMARAKERQSRKEH